MSQQPRAGKASGYRATRRRHLGNMLAAAANQLGTDMANDFETRSTAYDYSVSTRLALKPVSSPGYPLGLHTTRVPATS